ncbi:MAG: PilZ domain-containing protein [Terriglobales bacterium]
MTHFPQPHPQNRATRVKMEATASALVKLEDGQRTKAKIQTVSVTGGLLRLARALQEGDFVEVAFQTQSGPVQGMAEMLRPRRISGEGTLQPFRFIALEDNDHKTLSFAVDSTTERNFLLGPHQFSRKV